MASDTLTSDLFMSMFGYIQHGDTTTAEHCISVAYRADSRLRASGRPFDEMALIRAALLHDAFPYDWHDRSASYDHHATMHARYACEEASKAFDLSDLEREIILSHMWPLPPRRPSSREAWAVTFADKWSSSIETVLSHPCRGLTDAVMGAVGVTPDLEDAGRHVFRPVRGRYVI